MGKYGSLPLIFMDAQEAGTAKAVIKRLKSLHEERKIRLEIVPLKVGDFVVGIRMLERKRAKDFVSSILDNRIWNQATNLVAAAEEYQVTPCILIEGSISAILKWHNKFEPASFVGVWRSLIEDYGIEVIYSPNSYFTILWLLSFAKEKTEKKAIHAIRKASKSNWSKNKKARYVLEGFEGVGGVTSTNLLEEYGSCWNVFMEAKKKKPPKKYMRVLRKMADLLCYSYGDEPER